MTFNVTEFDVEKFDAILARGLSYGLGERGGQLCIEAAVCETLGLPHGDDPKCVASAVRAFKIGLNDSPWSSSEVRAKGLRDLGLAQLGSIGVVEDAEFATRVAEKTIRRLLPALLWSKYSEAEDAAAMCALEGTPEAAIVFKKHARIVHRGDEADVAACAVDAAFYAKVDAIESVDAAIYAAILAGIILAAEDTFLFMMADIGLETLKELNSPGYRLLVQEA